MPNKYSQPVQSQFVPTFVPFDPQVAQSIATGLQDRQEKGMESYDALEEMYSQVESKTLQQHKPIVREQLDKVRGNLDQAIADGDFTDLQPRIRKSAKELKENLRKGPLSKAVRSYENAQESVKNIKESNLSGTEKENLINTILADFKGTSPEGEVEEFDEFIPADYADPNQKARELIDGIPKQKIKEDTGWSETRVGDWIKRGKNIQELPDTVIESYLKPSLRSDPKVVDYLNQKAYVQTSGLPPEEREQKQKELIETYIDQAARLAFRGEGTEGRIVTDPETGEEVTFWGSSTEETTLSQFAPTSAQGDNYRIGIDTQGKTNLKNVWIGRDLGDVLRRVDRFEREGQQQNAKTLMGTVRNALVEFKRQNDKEITEDDISLMTQKGLAHTGASFTGMGTPWGLAATPPREYPGAPEITEEEKTRLQTLFGKFEEWLDQQGGYTDRGIAPNTATNEGRTAWRNVNDMINENVGSNPNAWTVVGKGEKESVDYLAENLGGLTFMQVVSTNKYSPTTIRVKDKNGQLIDLVEKPDPLKKYDATDAILDQLGVPGKRAKENRRLEHIPVKNIKENHYEDLPPVYQSSVPGNYFSYISDERGNINVTYGTEDDPKSFTTGDYFHAQIKEYRQGSPSPEDWEELRRKILALNENSPDPLTEEEIQKMDDDPGSVAQALRDAFSDPYGFPDRSSALNHIIYLNR